MSSVVIANRVLHSFELFGSPLAVGAVSEGLAPGYVVSGELGGAAVTANCQMYAASLTKQLVAALAALATTSGHVDPDACVRDLLPELPSWASRIRIRHLVHHISGMPLKGRVVKALACDGENELRNDAVIGALAGVEAPERPPGIVYEYNNVGYICLAEIVSRATASDLDELAQNWIFGPLGMTSSRLGGPPPARLPDHPTPPQTVGDGGWWTTASDLLRWQQALNDQALGSDVMQILETPGALDDGTPVPYCWGVAVSWRDGIRTFGHGGAVPGWTSKTVRQPAPGTAVALLSCCDDVPRISAAALHLADELTAACAPSSHLSVRPGSDEHP